MNKTTDHNGALVAWTIDDSEFDMKLNHRILTRSGAFVQVHGFHSPQDALDELRALADFPHVIFLDVIMPVMNGFDFLATATQEFGDDFASSVVIMLTSSLNPRDRAKAEAFDAVRGFLPKPLTIHDSQQVATDAAIIMRLVPCDETRATSG
ncbi:MAG: response regulator [Pseudomonadota bacterium]